MATISIIIIKRQTLLKRQQCPSSIHGIYLYAGCSRATNMTNMRRDECSSKGWFRGKNGTRRIPFPRPTTIARRNLLKMVKDERSCTSLPPGSFVPSLSH